MKKWMLALPLGIGGFVLIAWQSNWLVAVGVFLMIWGNNVERSNRT